MIVINKKSYKVGIITGIIGGLLGWLFSTYIMSSKTYIPFLGEVWIILHLPLHLIFLAIDPPAYLEDFSIYLGIFIQWFIIGYLISWWSEKNRRARKNPV